MDRDREVSAAVFRQNLSRLDTARGFVLLVGAVGSAGHRQACRALSPGSPDAFELLVSTDGFCHGPATASRARWNDRIIAYASDRRSASAGAPPVEPPKNPGRFPPAGHRRTWRGRSSGRSTPRRRRPRRCRRSDSAWSR